ncbi:MAG: UDP-3-O-acyl-N-acetylglucosamine deacetylase [Rhodobacteraceae bacterium]|nr:UDP-3-O-acyl-N-acetylglucosamine deacetylase [Paracoccaceae bacterium]
MQTTIRGTASFIGLGLHSSAPARLVLRPAPAGHGIRFRRTDLSGPEAVIPARWDRVVPSALCTRIASPGGASVATVEHLMAALAGTGVHNALAEIDGPEVPALDGSAAPFVRGILAAGIRRLEAPLAAIRVLAPVEVREGEAFARLDPAPGFEIDFRIDFQDRAIGRQEKRLDLANGAFLRELAASRTFCRRIDIEAMRAQGLARGGSLANAVVVDGDRVLNPGGLRHPDEPVRHKMLDALGDLALAGAPIVARYTGHRAGHALTARLLAALFADPALHATAVCDASLGERLPGLCLQPGDLAPAA